MSGERLVDRAVRLALRCYPSWWRERYGADQEAVVEDLAAERDGQAWSALDGWRVAAGFVAGAARARVSGSGMPAVPELWQQRTGAAIIAACVPAALALPLAVLLVVHTGQYGRAAPGATQPGPSTATRVAFWDATVLALLAFASLVQLLAGATALFRRVAAGAPPRRRALLVAAMVAPVLAMGAGFLLLHLSSSLKPVIEGTEKVRGHPVAVFYGHRGHPLAAVVLSRCGWVGVVGGWIAGVVTMAKVASHRRFGLQALGHGVVHARAVSGLQTGMALCVLVLGATLPFQPTGPGGGMAYRSDLGAWTPVVSTTLLAAASITWAATRAARGALSRAAPAP